MVILENFVKMHCIHLFYVSHTILCGKRQGVTIGKGLMFMADSGRANQKNNAGKRENISGKEPGKAPRRQPEEYDFNEIDSGIEAAIKSTVDSVKKQNERKQAQNPPPAARPDRQRRNGEGAPPPPQKPIGGGGCLSGVLYFVFVMGAAVIVATIGWISANDVLGLIKPDTTATMVITQDESISAIADQLKEKGLINYPFLFKIYGKLSNAEEKIDPGTYEVSADLDYRAIIYAMRESSASRATVLITIPEGYELSQVFTLLEDKGVATYSDLEKAADTHDYDYDFLADVPMQSGRLEGYLFPDTYEFYVGENPVNAIDKMLSNFDKKLTDDHLERAQELGLSIADVITIASLIEKEAAENSERATIASVIYNRLDEDDYLQIDATIQYFLEERKEYLTTADTLIDNPYNTYMYKGLPPGPICSPGLASITAALYPNDTNYYYYALNIEGTHNFFKTYAGLEEFLNSDESGV